MAITRLWILAALTMTVLLMGCATSEELKSVGDRVYSFDERFGTMELKVNQLNASVAELNTRISAVDAKVDMLAGIDRKDLGGPYSKGTTSNELMLLEQEISKLERRISGMEGGGTGASRRQEIAVSKPVTAKDFPIKVLAGGTNLEDAKLMAKRLVNSGYNVVVVDYSNSPVTEDTVYYMKGYAEEARKLANAVGPMAKTKIITWDSSFKLVAVKGMKK